MNALNDFTQHIHEQVAPMANEIVDKVIGRLNIEIMPEERGQAVGMYEAFLKFLADVLEKEQTEAVPAALIEWSRKNAEMVVSLDEDISLIVVRYPPTRDVFTELFTDLSVEFGLTVRENAFIIKRINNLLDVSLTETFSAFERFSKKKQEETQAELVKLSAPIVPIQDGVAVIPLIGFLDERRVQHILHNVIPQVADMDIDYVITDFSGVVTINEKVAEALQQIGGTLRLMGIHVLSAGLRPDLAQTIVNSGISMSKIESFSTVKQALKSMK